MSGQKLLLCLGIGLAIVVPAANAPAFAVSADLAKKCRDMAIKAHPFKVAGAKAGTAAAERSYFNDCVAKGGNMPEPTGGSDSNDVQAPPAAGGTK